MEPGQTPELDDRQPEAGGASPDPGAIPPGAPPPAEDRDATRRQRLKRMLTIGLAVAALLCLGGTAAAFVFYDKATAPDRSSPHATVDDYLRAFLGQRDDRLAAQYVCQDSSGLSSVRALRADMESREKQFSMSATFSWDVLGESPVQGGVNVEADIVILAVLDGKSQRALEHWEFFTRDEKNGWRVCDGHEAT